MLIVIKLFAEDQSEFDSPELDIPWMVILCGHNIKKKKFENFDF